MESENTENINIHAAPIVTLLIKLHKIHNEVRKVVEIE